MARDGVQTLIPGSLTPEQMSVERRMVAAELGIPRLERQSKSVLVDNKKVKAWRVRGTPEFEEHERLVKLMASVFSEEPPAAIELPKVVRTRSKKVSD
jgi:hypothetical protein